MNYRPEKEVHKRLRRKKINRNAGELRSKIYKALDVLDKRFLNEEDLAKAEAIVREILSGPKPSIS